MNRSEIVILLLQTFVWLIVSIYVFYKGYLTLMESYEEIQPYSNVTIINLLFTNETIYDDEEFQNDRYAKQKRIMAILLLCGACLMATLGPLCCIAKFIEIKRYRYFQQINTNDELPKYEDLIMNTNF